MADSSPLVGLLDRAARVFSLAGELGRAFHEQGQSRAIFFDPSIWQLHAPMFKEFCDAILGLRDAMQNPPDGFGPVVESLLEAARIAKGIRDTLRRDGGFTDYLDYFSELTTVCQSGGEAVKGVTKARRLDDPFAFINEPAFSLLDRLPATPAGHVAFLECIRDEVHYAAEAKRNQFAEKYSNDTIESMVHGIKWAEARARLAAIPDLLEAVRAKIDNILHRELTAGTVEQIDGLLAPAIRDVRNSFEQARLGELAGDANLRAIAIVPTLEEIRAKVQSTRERTRHPSANHHPDSHKADAHNDYASLLRMLRRCGIEAPELPNVHFHPQQTINYVLVALDEVELAIDRNAATIEQIAPAVAADSTPAAYRQTAKRTKAKTSTSNGEAQEKLIAALTKHHKYADGSCLNLAPIGNNELCRQARVGTGSGTRFFNKHFGGRSDYVSLCRNSPQRLSLKLAVLSGEAHKKGLANFGRNPPGEGGSDDDD